MTEWTEADVLAYVKALENPGTIIKQRPAQTTPQGMGRVLHGYRVALRTILEQGVPGLSQDILHRAQKVLEE